MMIDCLIAILFIISVRLLPGLRLSFSRGSVLRDTRKHLKHKKAQRHYLFQAIKMPLLSWRGHVGPQHTNSDTLRVVMCHCPCVPKTCRPYMNATESSPNETRVFTTVSSLLFINYCDKLLGHVTCQVLLPIFCMAIRF